MSWRWIFFVNVPVGTLAIVVALRVLQRDTHRAAERLDVLGFALLALGVPSATYGLAEIGTTGQLLGPRVIIPILAGVALIALFVLHALRDRRPLLDVRLYRRPTFSAASVGLFSLSGAMFGSIVVYALYWQQVRGESALDTGLLLIPTSIGMVLVMSFVGRMADRVGGGLMAFVGAIVTTAATIPLGLIGAHTSVALLSAAMGVRGMGLGLVILATMTAAFASLERSEISDATPQLHVLMRIGGSIGTAVLAVVLQRELAGAAGPHEAAAAFGSTFWWAVAISAVAIIPAYVLYRTERKARTESARDSEAPLPSVNEQVAEGAA
jgi:MFS family permease